MFPILSLLMMTAVVATPSSHQAERLMQVASYEEAAAIYRQILESNTEPTVIATMRYQLANALFLAEKHTSVIELLTSHIGLTSPEWRLLALSCKASEDPPQAYEQFKRYLTMQEEGQDRIQGWYLYGCHVFYQGQRLKEQNKEEESLSLFASSSRAFQTMNELFASYNKPDSYIHEQAMGMKYLAVTYLHQNSGDFTTQALNVIEALIADDRLMSSVDQPDEVFYLHGLILSKSAEQSDKAKDPLRKIIQTYPQGSYTPQALYLLGTMAYDKGDFNAAESYFAELVDHFPEHAQAGDALFFAALSAEELRKEPATYKNYRQHLLDSYPESRYADEAYFTLFTPEEYLQGDPSAMQHLQQMGTKYPQSRFLIHAYYLLGLDQRRGRKATESSPEKIRHLVAAIDAFQEAESYFERWVLTDGVSKDQLEHFIPIYFRALLERAYANIAIADLSRGAKKRIYMEYAIDLLERSIRMDSHSESLVFPLINHHRSYSTFCEEAEYLAAQAYCKVENSAIACKIFDRMLDRYQKAQITRGYFLSRIWYDKGVIAMKNGDYNSALTDFGHAEEAAKGKVLSVDQQLDLWLQKSDCYRQMNQLDNAMLILSQVINEDAVSNLRLKAMYLRANIYELQGRHELALKQLQATANKGGEWGHKSKMKLEKDYGWHE